MSLTTPTNVPDGPAINLLVLDLECTCEQNVVLTPSEIIEIGAVIGLLTPDTFTVISEIQIYVRPIIHPILTEFCNQLTGITQATVEAADTLSEALPLLHDWLQGNGVVAWASWGKFDCNQLTRECELKKLSNPMSDIKHINLKQLFARKFGHRVGLERALDLREMDFEGVPHSGIDDTKNIARLVSAELLLREALLKRIAPTI